MSRFVSLNRSGARMCIRSAAMTRESHQTSEPTYVVPITLTAGDSLTSHVTTDPPVK